MLPNRSNETIGKYLLMLKERLPGASVVEITLYGSSAKFEDSTANDIDLFVVLEEEVDHERIVVGSLDVVVLGLTEARWLGEKFDPLVTEPVLTGRTVLGSPVVAKSTLESGAVSVVAREHLLFRAKEVLSWTISSSGGLNGLHHLMKGPFFRNIIENLCYVVSYLAFYAHYRCSPRVVTLEQLTQVYPESVVVALRGIKSEKVGSGRRLEVILDRLVDTLTYQSASHFDWVLGAYRKL